MTEKKLCKTPYCGCDFEEHSILDEDELSYCTDTKTPILCEVKEVACKYPDILCEHQARYDNDWGDEKPVCYAIRQGLSECPFKVYESDDENWTLQETLDKSPYWTLNGFQYWKDKFVVDEKVIMAIQNWAGDCTEPNSGQYKDIESMFNALDLIYKLIYELRENPLTIKIKERFSGEGDTVQLNQITSIDSDIKRIKS